MSSNKMINKLRRRIENYVSVSDEAMKAIESQSEMIDVKKQETLVNYGELCNKRFFIYKGSFEISLVLNDGSKKTVWFFMDELFNIATCPDSLVLNIPTTYEITALEDSTVMKINYQALLDIFDRNLQLYKYKVEVFLNDLMIMNEIRSRIMAYKPIEVMEYLKDNFPMLLNRIPDKNLASLMGMTPGWYSKIKKSSALN